MLILTRANQGRLHIGDDITVQVVEIRTNTVRLGIEAPRHLRVDREEIRQEIEQMAKSNHKPAPVTVSFGKRFTPEQLAAIARAAEIEVNELTHDDVRRWLDQLVAQRMAELTDTPQ